MSQTYDCPIAGDLRLGSMNIPMTCREKRLLRHLGRLRRSRTSGRLPADGVFSAVAAPEESPLAAECPAGAATA